MTTGIRLLSAIATVGAAGMATSPPLADEAIAPVTHRVAIERFRFVPARIEIRPGDRVEWINRDIAPHSATDDSARWDSGALAKDTTQAIAFPGPGTFAYRCAFHPDMRGIIVVIDEPR